jgi:hypothetical protein
MGYSRPTFEVQGVTFKLKPTSPRNVKALSDYIEESDIEDPEDVEGGRDPFEETAEQWMKILELIAEPQDGTLEDIDPMGIDINKVDYYLADFTPVETET